MCNSSADMGNMTPVMSLAMLLVKWENKQSPNILDNLE